MIISKNSKVMIAGTSPEMFSDLVSIIKCLIWYEDISSEDIIELVKDIKEVQENENET